MNVVTRAERSVQIDQILRHDEERNTLDAGRRVGRARQHHVNDVVGVIVIAVGDEDLLAVELVRAIALRYGAGSHGREIRSGLRLGQIHRSGPRAVDHLWQKRRLLLGRRAQFERLDRALRQQRTQVERHVRRMPHFLDGRRNELRQSLAAIFRIFGEPVPAVLDELPIRLLEARGGLHAAIRESRRTLAIPRHVQRVKHVARELGGLFENGGDGVGRRFFEARQRRDLRETRKVIQNELHFLKRSVIGAHGIVSAVGSRKNSLTDPIRQRNLQ